MNTIQEEIEQNNNMIGPDFFDRLWEQSWTYIKTVVDVAHEPILILDESLMVLAANDSFYRTFQVEARDTEQKNIYQLGNGQWDIPVLRKLLEDVLPKNTFFKGFEVTHIFPVIGQKTMILNARQIYFKEKVTSKLFPPIILLAMEDVTEIMAIAETLAMHTKNLEGRLSARTQKLEDKIIKLEKKINQFKKVPTLKK